MDHLSMISIIDQIKLMKHKFDVKSHRYQLYLSYICSLESEEINIGLRSNRCNNVEEMSEIKRFE